MFCTGCGNTIGDTEKFCRLCGRPNLHFSEQTGAEIEPASEEPKAAADEVLGKKTEENTNPPAKANIHTADNMLPIQVPSETEPAIASEEKERIPNQTINRNGQEEAAGARLETAAAAGPEEAVFTYPSYSTPEVNRNIVPDRIVETPSLGLQTYYYSPQAKSYGQQMAEAGKKRNKGLMIGSAALSAAAFIMAVLMVSAVFALYIFSHGTLLKAANRIDYTNVELGDILSDSDYSVNADEGDTTLDIVYKALSEEGSVDITKYELEEVFEESTIPEYISDKLAQYSRYALTGEKPEEINPREIVRLVKDNKRIIEKITGLSISSDDLNEMEENLETNEKELFDTLSVKNMEKTIAENNLKGIQTLFSNQMLIVILILSAILFAGIIILICILHKKSLSPLNFIGIPVLLTGLIFIIGMIIGVIMKDSILNRIGGLSEVLEPVITSFLGKGIAAGTVTAAVGFLLILAYIIAMSSRRKRLETHMNLTGQRG